MLSSHILWSFLLSITLTGASIAPNTWVNETALADIWRSNDDAQVSGALKSSSDSSSGNSFSSTTSQRTSSTKYLTTISSTSSTSSLAAETTSGSSSANATNLASSGLLSNLTLLPTSGGGRASSYPSSALVYLSAFVAMLMILVL